MRARPALALLLLAAAALLPAAPGAAQSGAAGRKAAPAGSERAVRLFEPMRRSAEGLLPVARTALGERGRVALDRGRGALVLAGPPEAVEAALALLRERDVAPRTVLLRYEARSLDALRSAGVSVDWSGGAAPLRVGRLGRRGEPRKAGAELRGGLAAREGEAELRGTIRIVEGELGRIVRGRTVPVRRGHPLRAETRLVTGERGFAARPRILGDGRIEVELWPVDAVVDERGRVEFTEASTRTVVEPGETVVVASTARSGRSRAARAGAGAGARTQRTESERVLLLTAALEGSPEP